MQAKRHARLVLLSVIVAELVTVLLRAGRKPLWFDELVTMHISGLQPLSRLWSALQAGADAMPPAYYFIVHLARMFPGDPQITVRLPSILGYLMTLPAVYFFLRKRLPPVACLVGVVMIAMSPFREYAFEARPYALSVGLLAVSLALWQRIGERRFIAPCFALSLALAVACHPLTVVTVSLFGLAEVTRTVQMRKFRWTVWAACVAAMVPFFLGLPLLMHFRTLYGISFWSKPTWGTLVTTYSLYLGSDAKLPLVLIAFFGIVAVNVFRRRSAGTPPDPAFTLPEILLIGGLAIYPVLLVVITKVFNSAYVPRYGWPAILGLVLGSVYLLAASRLSPAHLLGALLLVFAVRTAQDVRPLLRRSPAAADPGWNELAAQTRRVPGIPVVMVGMDYLAALQYGPADLRDRLIQVVDPDLAARLVGTDTVDRAVQILARYVPLRIEDLRTFEPHSSRFLLHSDPGSDWLTPYLFDKGYRFSLISPDSSVQLVERVER